MFEANNPEVDVRQLAARIDLELERPVAARHASAVVATDAASGNASAPAPAPEPETAERPAAASEAPAPGEPGASPPQPAGFKDTLRRRLHTTPGLGFALRWVKSLRLLNLTRHQAREALARNEHTDARLHGEIQAIRQEFAALSGHLANATARADRNEDTLAAMQDRLAGLGDEVASLGSVTEGLSRGVREVDSKIDGVHERQNDLERRVAESLDAMNSDFETRLQGVKDTYGSTIEALDSRTYDLERRVHESLRDMVRDFEARLEGVKGEYRGRDEEFSSLLRRFAERLDRLADRADLLHGDVLFQQRRLDKALEGPSKAAANAPAADETAESKADSHVPHLFDQFYEAFEDRFRGDREDIKTRQRVYLDTMRESRAGSDGRPVLDIGCGRGEWLELLRDEGLTGYGIDVNAMAVDACLEHALDAREADMLTHLASLGDGTLGAITAFHVIEHLPIETLLAFLDEARRTLARDGVLILETPNPENLIVGAHTFHNDPTHRAPIPPAIARFMAEQRGFGDVRIQRLHPNASAEPFPDDEATGRKLNELLYGPQDYAVIGRRP